MNKEDPGSWTLIWKQYQKNRIGMIALSVFLLFCLIGLYAPFFASSKPLFLAYDGKIYFPLFRYLFYSGFYTKKIDLFFNLLMFTLPVAVAGWFFLKRSFSKKIFLGVMGVVQIALFLFLSLAGLRDPASDVVLLKTRQEALQKELIYRTDPLLAPFPPFPSWQFDLKHLSNYEKLNLLLRYRQRKMQHAHLAPYAKIYQKENKQAMNTLWESDRKNELSERARLENELKNTFEDYLEAQKQLPQLTEAYRPYAHKLIYAKTHWEQLQKSGSVKESDNAKEEYEKVLEKSQSIRQPLVDARNSVQKYKQAEEKLRYLNERQKWLEDESQKLHFVVSPLIRSFHWEEDAGGAQSINKYIPWWDLTRISRKDLASALFFGVRVSIIVGLSAVTLSLLVGIPFGMISAYFAGKTDLFLFRVIEIWEAMPTFFMLLLVIAISQNKSIFLVILVLGIFGWTGFARFIRGEVLKQRNLPYVLACHNLGFRHPKIMFSHILPNAIAPVLTLLPFSMMAAITSEAGLSFLGLGEAGSASWGVLMDEGRSVFPGESYLLWPPAILLTVFLVSIALIGDALRDALDPRMRK